MCSRLLPKMENFQGDLADILRASGGGSNISSSAQVSVVSAPREWQFPGNQVGIYEEPSFDEFGDPFSTMRDPFFLHEINHLPSSCFFDVSSSTGHHIITSNTATVTDENTQGVSGSVSANASASAGVGGCNNNNNNNNSSSNSSLLAQRILDDHELGTRRPSNNNIFTRMLQISPNAKLPLSPRDSQLVMAGASPRGLKPPSLVATDMINCTASSNSKASLIENNPVVQISSPRNSGIKRRKSQAKKVVCIPAPAPANSRPSSGEIVPSDLWAWRKYGQKPIKGSPYPRGYYRCSSSKGCSARKQVERSRTDPNMLVITYTSEHNHPWPTQRNALAGSTRTQPVKSGGSSSKTTNNSQSQKATTTPSLKEEEKPVSQTDNASSPMVNPASSSTGQLGSVKEELIEMEMEMEMEDLDKKLEMDGLDHFSEGFSQSYKPALPDSSNHSEDFFADLTELEADPLNLLFTQGYSSGVERENKNLELFSFYDWTTSNSTTSTTTTTTMTITTSVEEAKKGS